MRYLSWLDVEDIIKEDQEALCPQCHGKVSYSLESTKTEESEYLWRCENCGSVYEPYELRVIIGEGIND